MDYSYLLLIIGFIIVLISQLKINSAYAKYSSVKSSSKLTGFEVARKILDKNKLNDIHIVEVQGKLTDHYDPKQKVVRLSSDIFNGDSIASISVAAHECGHAIQDKDNYVFMRIRASLVPIVNFITKFGYFATIIGILVGIFDVIICGIVMLLATLIFQLVTLPVEFDASSRAKEEIKNLKFASSDEQDGVKKMLSAAAFTYVASVLNTFLNLLRLLVNIDRHNKR